MADKPSSPPATTAGAAPKSPSKSSTAKSPEKSPSPRGPASPQNAPETHPDVQVLPAEHWAQMGTVDDDDDADSTLGTDAQSSTASISSSILKYRTLHGRTYHSDQGEAKYWGTNDDRHNNSLDILHHVFTLCLGDKLYLAPIEAPKKVIDIGTGTGIWVIDFADTHPEAEVIGTDISPIQPTWVPPNVQFEIENFTNDWTFEEGSISFVHARYLVGSVPDWYKFFAEAYRVLEPGGFVESFEASPTLTSDDGTVAPGSACSQWGPLFFKGGETIGHTFRVLEDDIQTKAMEAAGFVDIQVKNIKCPVGVWPQDPRQREIGEVGMVAALSDIEGFILFMTNILGWTREEVTVYQAHLRREIRSGQVHVYYWQRIVYARKPVAAPAAAAEAAAGAA